MTARSAAAVAIEITATMIPLQPYAADVVS
jgi:hypothetical protein